LLYNESSQYKKNTVKLIHKASLYGGIIPIYRPINKFSTRIGSMNNLNINEKYLVDKEGHRIGVFLTMQEYRSLIKRLEELESLKSAREEINIVDQLLAEANQQPSEENLPNFKRRQGPGGMIVV
jgi:hypothetical protein